MRMTEEKVDTRSLQPSKFLLYTNRLVHDALRHLAFIESTVNTVNKHTSMSSIAQKVLVEALPCHIETTLFNHKTALDEGQKQQLLKLKQELENS
jgi:hypothetical protein